MEQKRICPPQLKKILILNIVTIFPRAGYGFMSPPFSIISGGVIGLAPGGGGGIDSL
jgi:hypothetical protein